MLDVTCTACAGAVAGCLRTQSGQDCHLVLWEQPEPDVSSGSSVSGRVLEREVSVTPQVHEL